MSKQDTLTQVVDTLKQTGVEAQLDALMKQVGTAPDEIEEFFGQLQGKLEGLKRTLPEIDKKHINENLEALRSRLPQYQEGINQSLAALSLRSTELVSTVEGQATAAVETSKSLLTKAGDSLEHAADVVFPKRLTKNMDRNTKMILAAGTGAIVAYAAYKGMKWLFGRSTDAIDAGSDAARKTKGGLFKKVMVGLGITGLAFGSYKLYELYNKYGSMTEAMKKWGEEIKEGGKIIADEAKEGLGLDGEEAEEDSDEEKSEEDLRDKVEDGVEILGSQGKVLLSKGMLFMYSGLAEELGIDEDFERDAVGSALLTISRDPNISVEDMTKTTTKEQAMALFNVSERAAPSYLFLCKVAQRNESRMKAIWERAGKTWEPATISAFTMVELIGDAPRVIASITSNLRGKNINEINFSEILGETFGDSEGAPEGAGLQIVKNPATIDRILTMMPGIAGDTPEERQKFAKEFAVFISKERSLTLEDFVNEYKDSDLPEAKAVLRVIEEVKSDKMRQYFELYTHGREDTREALNKQLDAMLVGDAMQLFSYANLTHGELPETIDASMLKDGDGMGAVLLQMKILRLVGKQDEDVGRDFKYFLINSVASEDIPFPEEAKDILLKISVFAAEEAENALIKVLTALLKEGESAISEWAKQNPKTATYVGITTTGVASVAIYRYLSKPMEERVLARMTRIEGALKNPGKMTRIRSFLNLNKVGEEFASRVAHLQERLRVINKHIGTLGDSTGKLRASYRSFLSQGFHKASFDRFAESINEIRKAAVASNDTRVITACDDILKEVRAVASDAKLYQYGRFGSTRRLFHWVTWRHALRSSQIPEALNILDEFDDVAESNVVPRTTPSSVPRTTIDDGGPVRKPTPAPDAPEGPKLKVVNEAGETIDPATGKVIDTAEDLADAGPENVAKAVDALVDQDSWARALESVGGKLTMDNIDEFLDWARQNKLLQDDMIDLISRSRSAKTLIVGAAESGDLVEINRVLRAAKGTRALGVMKILGAVGFVGDALGVYMAYADFMANQGRLESARQTNNQALLDLYNHANVVYAAEGAGSAVGLTIGTVAIVNATVAGESVTAALSTAGGTVMLPIAVATLAGRAVYNQAEKVTETWSRTAEDWIQTLTPGEILEKLKEIGPGSYSYWQGWGTGTVAEQAARRTFSSRESYMKWEEEGAKNIEGANTGSRIELTRAYVLSTSMLAQQERESDAAFQKRFDQYVVDQMYYLGNRSGGKYDYQYSSGYERARDYARLMAKSRQLQKSGESEILEWKDSEGKTVEFDLANYQDIPLQQDNAINGERVLDKYRDKEISMSVLQMNLMQQMKTDLAPEQKRQIIKSQLLMECVDGLNKLEGRIANADFNGIFSSESMGEAYARYVAAKIFKEDLTKQTDELLSVAASKNGLSPKQYRDAIQRLYNTLDTQDPLKFQEQARAKGYYREGYVVDPASVRNALSFGVLMQDVSKEAEWVQLKKEIDEDIAKSSPEDRKEMCRMAGDSYGLKEGMNSKYKHIIGNEHPEYLYIKYGNVFNKNLYVKFTGGKWKVALGGGGEGPWHDPSSYRATASTFGFSESVAAKYNRLIRGYADINNSY